MNIANTIIPSTPYSEPWTAWVLLLLLIVAVMIFVRRPELFKGMFTSLFSKSERTYNDASLDRQTNVLMSMFRVGTLALTVYLCLFQEGKFSLLIYLAICGCILLFSGLKWLMVMLTSYVFFLQVRLDVTRNNYNSIWLLITLLMYPLTIIMVDFGFTTTCRVLMWVLLGLYILLAILKTCRMFLTSPMSVLYITIYILTLEVLPLAALYAGVRLVA